MNDNDQTKFFLNALAQPRNHDLMELIVHFIGSNPDIERKFFMQEVEAQSSAEILQFASDGIKSDKRWFMEMAAKNIDVMEYASDQLKNDKELALVSVTQSRTASSAQWFGEAIKADFEVALACAKKFGRSLYHFGGAFSNNKEIAVAAVQSDGYSLPLFSVALQNDPEVYSPALSSSHVLKAACNEVRDNRDAVLLAAATDSEALRWSSDRLCGDKKFVLEVFRIQKERFKYIPLEYASQDIQEICKDKDPIQALESAVLAERLTAELSRKPQASKLKI